MSESDPRQQAVSPRDIFRSLEALREEVGELKVEVTRLKTVLEHREKDDEHTASHSTTLATLRAEVETLKSASAAQKLEIDALKTASTTLRTQVATGLFIVGIVMPIILRLMHVA